MKKKKENVGTAIAAIPSGMFVAWRNINDETPEEGSASIVYIVDGNYHYIGITRFVSGRFEYDGVTHWMPFPLPPKIEVEQTKKKHFSPEEVHNMTPKEVRENLAEIMKSMRKWK